MSSKIEEAKEHIKAAEKALKTSFLKWKPDYDTAADEYSQAAQCYKIARDMKTSKDFHVKASEYYEKNNSFFHAGKSLENAVIVSKEFGSPQELSLLAKKSSELYQQHGSGDSAANVLDKAAKIIEEKSPEVAMKMYQYAADVSATESGSHQATEYMGKASRILVRLGMYDQALDCLRREIGLHLEHGNIGAVGRLTVVMVLVQLARGDPVAAEKAYKEWGCNCEQAEVQNIEQLLTAFDEEDHDAAKQALSSPFIRHMDVDYAKLAIRIPLPAVMQPQQKMKGSVVEHAAASYESSSAQRPQQSSAAAAEATSSPGPEEEEDELC